MNHPRRDDRAASSSHDPDREIDVRDGELIADLAAQLASNIDTLRRLALTIVEGLDRDCTWLDHGLYGLADERQLIGRAAQAAANLSNEDRSRLLNELVGEAGQTAMRLLVLLSLASGVSTSGPSPPQPAAALSMRALFDRVSY